MAALDHPNVIPIYDAGDADGIVYIAMRCVTGADLAEVLERDEVLPPARALAILEQVGGALDAAHAHDLVHRDVKPANVLIEGDGERVYLTDFGIAKQARSKGLTRTGFFVGTLDYAAPEQIQGLPVGPPADVYAFGCLAFECLTGRKPFDRETDVAVMHAHLLDPPPSVVALRPELPAEVDDVFAIALAKGEDDRAASCREVVEMLRAALGEGTSPSEAGAAVPSTRRRRVLEHNLPVQATPIVGRDAELAAVTELLRRDDVRLVTLTGLGGTGKTRLSVAVAEALVEELGRAWFVDLAPVREPHRVGSAIAQTLGVEEAAGRSITDAVATRIGADPALLVLDNFEQVLPAAELVGELLARVGAAEGARDDAAAAAPSRGARVPGAAARPPSGRGRRPRRARRLGRRRALHRPRRRRPPRLRADRRERIRRRRDLPAARRPPARDRARGRAREAPLAAGDRLAARVAARPPHRRRA